MKTYSGLFIVAVAWFMPFAAQAASCQTRIGSLPSLPVACLPERAVPWIDGKPESQQAACHCPPLDMCPKTYDEYKNNEKAKMPFGFVKKCCPEIKPPGRELPEVPEGCPVKSYPTLTEAGMFNGPNFTNRYRGLDGVQKNFEEWSFGARLTTGFPYYLRRVSAINWGWGPQACIGLSNIPGFSVPLGNSACAFQDGYMPLTGGINDGLYRPLGTDSTWIPQIGANNLVWFGASYATENNLPPNAVTPNVLKRWGGRDHVQIADNTVTGVDTVDITKSRNWEIYNSQDAALGAVLDAEMPQLVRWCRLVQGEYLALESQDVGGKQCPYLQCRYIYDSWGGESCLNGSAKVTLADGATKPVSEVAVGDRVKTDSGEAKVTALNQYRSGLRVLYGLNGGEALLTGDHPIRTTDGWKVITPEAAKLYADKEGFAKTALAVGDTLITGAGEVVVKSIDRHAKVDPISTYNIRVDGNAGFYADGFEVKGFDKMEMQYR